MRQNLLYHKQPTVENELFRRLIMCCMLLTFKHGFTISLYIARIDNLILLNNITKIAFYCLLLDYCRAAISWEKGTCGYGLRIMHLSGGGGVRLGAASVGNYCGFNAGVLIGTNGSLDARPTLGDHVAFGPGAKAFGKINIGSHVFVAANAVVVKDVPDNCIVGGVPAKVIKRKEE